MLVARTGARSRTVSPVVRFTCAGERRERSVVTGRWSAAAKGRTVSDFYLRDWNNADGTGDDGTQPNASDGRVFWASGDVFNRTAAGIPPAAILPPNQQPVVNT